MRASYTFAKKHSISVLYAPLQFKSSGNFSKTIKFGEANFLPNEITDVNYKFNSYRLSYRYRLVDRKKISFGIGLTAKLRDARIRLSTASKQEETTDLGFVPLIHFRLNVYPGDNLLFTLRGDALVGTQGRAEDVFAGFEYSLNKTLALKAGYRILEGGADVDQVYNFSLIHYAAVGFVYKP